MKKTIALLLTLILVSTPLLFGSNALAQGTDRLEYTENSSGITITSIEIPENGILKVPEKIELTKETLPKFESVFVFDDKNF